MHNEIQKIYTFMTLLLYREKIVSMLNQGLKEGGKTQSKIYSASLLFMNGKRVTSSGPTKEYFFLKYIGDFQYR